MTRWLRSEKLWNILKDQRVECPDLMNELKIVGMNRAKIVGMSLFYVIGLSFDKTYFTCNWVDLGCV